MMQTKFSHRSLLTALGLTIAALAASGCPGLGSLEQPVGDATPETPTWSEHVKPVLDKYCNECHSSPPQQAAPATIRLDVCENVGGTSGAQAQAQRIIIRTIDELPTPMPPATYAVQPGPDDEEILRRWVEQGASCSDAPANNGGANNASNNGMLPGNNTPMPDMGIPDGMDAGVPDSGGDAGADAGPDADPDMGEPVWTFAQVADFLRATCVDCHGVGGGKGNLEILAGISDADLATVLMGTASSGRPFVTPLDPAESELYRQLNSGAMPPGNAMPARAADIRAWIEAGADYGN